jgi:hypothetical protein
MDTTWCRPNNLSLVCLYLSLYISFLLFGHFFLTQWDRNMWCPSLLLLFNMDLPQWPSMKSYVILEVIRIEIEQIIFSCFWNGTENISEIFFFFFFRGSQKAYNLYALEILGFLEFCVMQTSTGLFMKDYSSTVVNSSPPLDLKYPLRLPYIHFYFSSLHLQYKNNGIIHKYFNHHV